MALILTIPDIVESQELMSVSTGADGVSFTVMFAVGAIAARLMRAAIDGEHIPLVVLTTDSQILALDDVYITDVSQTGGAEPIMQLTLAAKEVRFV